MPCCWVLLPGMANFLTVVSQSIALGSLTFTQGALFEFLDKYRQIYELHFCQVTEQTPEVQHPLAFVF